MAYTRRGSRGYLSGFGAVTLGAVTATSVTSSGAVSGTTGTFSGLLSGAGILDSAHLIENAYVIATQLAVSTNNWNPTGLGTKKVIYVDAAGAIDLTGIAAQTDGYTFELVVYGANAITLKHASASSSAANRFNLPGAVDFPALSGFKRVTLRYGMSNTEWQVVSMGF